MAINSINTVTAAAAASTQTTTKTAETYCPTVLEVRCPKSWCQQGQTFFPEVLGEDPFPASFVAFSDL